MALAPLAAYLKGSSQDSDVLVVNTFETSRVSLSLGGNRVDVRQDSSFPFFGRSELRITSSSKARFGMRIRVPDWSAPLEIRVNSKKASAQTDAGWAVIPTRDWKGGDVIQLAFQVGAQLVKGEHHNQGLTALKWGPFVMAYDTSANPTLPASSLLQFAEKSDAAARNADGSLQIQAKVASPRYTGMRNATFLPFADAGADKELFQVWLASAGKPLKDIPRLQADGSMLLFDGQTFEGWEGDTNKTWRIENGEIVGGSLAANVPRNEFLCTKREFTNFVLRLKFKLTGKSGFINAGIQIRSQRVTNPPNEMAGYQADLGDPDYWGSLYDEGIGNKTLAKAEVEALNQVLKRNDWNDYTIRAEGRRVRLSINGVQTIDYTEPDRQRRQSGVIGLQIHGGAVAEVRYKDIRLQDLP